MVIGICTVDTSYALRLVNLSANPVQCQSFTGSGSNIPSLFVTIRILILKLVTSALTKHHKLRVSGDEDLGYKARAQVPS
jgi:hypothetical protein